MAGTDWQDGGFGLYLHWPFCQAKCPYCDFNSHVASRIDQARWVDAYLGEIDRLGAETRGRRLDSLYFGGGTPSLMEGETVSAILDGVRATWLVANDWEVTLEANPTSVEATRFRAYRDAGVNRVSLGVQALNDGDLARLGRLHSADEARAAIGLARETFDRVSFDLIYARQHQTADAWAAELDEALAVGTDHISLYQLTIEPGTAFADRLARGGLSGLPDEDLGADLYEMTLARCAEAGLSAYEVSNLARPGAESRHNLIYWTAGDYVGIGPGAHGRLTLDGQRWATEALRMPGAWLEAVESGGKAAETRTRLTCEDERIEYLMMGLRLSEGIVERRLAGMGASEAMLERIDRLVREGYLLRGNGRIAATGRGRMILNALIRELAD